MPSTVAQSPWPQTSGGPANHRSWPGCAPGAPALTAAAELPSASSDSRPDTIGNGVIGSDGSIFVAHHGHISRLQPDAAVLWSKRIADLADATPTGTERATWHSAPTALADGTVFLTAPRSAIILDAAGNALQVAKTVTTLDDSGPSPTVLANGTRLLTSPSGEIYTWDGGDPVEIGTFGYDIVPPPVYPDDSVAVSGYAAVGLARVTQTGTTVWRSPPTDADFVASINDDQQAAVGSRNDQLSYVVSSSGKTLFTYPAAAVFSVHPSGDWIALSDDKVARLTTAGAVIWESKVQVDSGWGASGALCDAQGRVLVLSKGELVAFDPDGEQCWSLKTPEGVGSLFPVSESRLALLGPTRLHLLTEA